MDECKHKPSSYKGSPISLRTLENFKKGCFTANSLRMPEME
jgi:hypothetical protein